MARNPETNGYVTWADVAQALRWFSAGYGQTWRVECEQRCPVGEQFTKLYWRIVPCDAAGTPIAMHRKVEKAYPQYGHVTVPGVLLDLAYQLDGLLHETHIWAEPKIAVEPQRGRPKGRK